MKKIITTTLMGLCALSTVNAKNLSFGDSSLLSRNMCSMKYTGEKLDLAINSDAYFVISSNGSSHQQQFTRFGNFRIDDNGYLMSDDGYVLKVNHKRLPLHLSKIKISTAAMPPKATENVSIAFILSTQAAQFQTSITTYDALSNKHVLTLDFSRKNENKWRVKVIIDNKFVTSGNVTYKADGTFMSEEGLSNINWSNIYGMDKLSIHLDESMQYATQSQILKNTQDGHPIGVLSDVYISRDGEIRLMYSNGQYKKPKGHIAIAKFDAPQFMDKLSEHLYRPTDKSGQPMIHWSNSEYQIVYGYLSDDECNP